MTWAKILCIGVLLLSVGCAETAMGARSDQGDAMDPDRQFLLAASGSCTWKMAVSGIALKQAASQDVRIYGESLIRDHQRIRSELKGYADQNGITLSDQMDRVQKNTLDFLAGEHGAAFDRQYMSLMMDDNQKDADMYRTESQKGKHKDIRAFAGRVAKIMEEYVRLAGKILLDLPQPLLK